MAVEKPSWGTARRILRYLQPHRALLAGAFACMLLLAATTSAYAYLTGPLLAFLLTGGEGGLGALGRVVPGLVDHLDRQQALLVLPVAIVAVALIKGAAYLGQFYGMGILGQRVVAAIRRDLVARFLALSPPWFETQHTGDLLSRFTTDVASIELFATYGVASVLRDSAQIASLLALAFVLDWRLALLAILIVPLAALPVARLAQRLRRSVRAGQDSLGRLGARVQEGLWGLRVLQAYGAEDAELARFDHENTEYLRQQRLSIRARALAPALVEFLVVAALAGTLAFAARAVNEGLLRPDVLVSFLATMALLYQPAKDLGRVSPWLLQATAGAERVFEVLDAVDPLGASPVSAPELPPMQRALTFEGVGLSYGEKVVLRDFAFELKRGEVLGLVGESGGGKSTAVKLALRFLDPTAGSVRVDGVDLRSVSLRSARGQFALVTQEALLFDDTIRANLAYARPGATDAQVEEVARIGGADAFIRALPQGYATPIGERGVRLSGGQKQRLALARALLADAPVLVLDEATSALDPESEREVQATLDVALRGRTALVIAHRVSAVRAATRIAVLRGGRITELGSHTELLAQRGEYARLCMLQGEPGPEASQLPLAGEG